MIEVGIVSKNSSYKERGYMKMFSISRAEMLVSRFRFFLTGTVFLMNILFI
jgi:hypothetical protein